MVNYGVLVEQLNKIDGVTVIDLTENWNVLVPHVERLLVVFDGTKNAVTVSRGPYSYGGAKGLFTAQACCVKTIVGRPFPDCWSETVFGYLSVEGVVEFVEDAKKRHYEFI